MSSQFKIGQRVRIQDGREGVVRFFGETGFKEGDWLGLELDDPDGKNDGSVRGDRYFECPPQHGLFIQSSPAIEIIAEAPPPAPKANGRPVSQTPKSRPSSVSRPLSVTAPSPRPRHSISGAPAKRASIAASTTSTARAEARRQSMAPPPSAPTRTSRPSAVASRSLSPKKSTPLSSRPSSVGTSLTGTRPSLRPSLASSPSPSIDRVLSPRSSDSSGKAPKPEASTGPPPGLASRGTPAGGKANQELESKLRMKEKQLAEARERIKELEPAAQQLEQYQSVIQKLQAKAKANFQDNNELKKQVKEMGDHITQLEKDQDQHESMMEMATLDKEMAEEKTDAMKAELDGIKGHLQELQLDNKILKEENEELSKDMSPEERASQGWVQMQRENTRLRDALLRLRDITEEREAGLKEEIELLEEDSQELVKVTEEYEETKAQFLESQAELEDLRERLDANDAAEGMIEELTEQNHDLGDRIRELRNEVEDLRSLNELNEELEESHNENAKQLQTIVDTKESLIAEQTRRALQQEEQLADRDWTISQFRELVTNLKSNLDDMRASKELTEAEARELGSHSRTMLDLNRQLQVSAVSTKVKTIEMELRKMEAQEASEHLAIVQLFLPDAFHSERDSVLAFLRFKRIAFKSRLLHSFMKERVSSPGPHAHLDHLLAACDALDKLTWISTMCDRFTNSISSSSLEEFAKFESALHELEVVERTLNGYIENLRKDELREQEVTEGLRRSIAVLKHLSELHLRSDTESYAEEVLMNMLLTQSHLDTTATALVLTKNELLKVIPASEEGDDEMSEFAERADAVAMQSRSAKVIVSKILRSLQELKTQNLALTLETQPNIEACQATTDEFASSLRTLGTSLHDAINDEARVSDFGLADLLSAVRAFNASQYNATDADVFAPLQANIKALHQRLSDINTVASDLSMTVEFERSQPPWVLRSKELQNSKSISADAEQEILALKREINERGTTIKLRDKTLEEANVNIEVLNAKMRDVTKKADKITELEKSVDAAQDNERKLQEKVSQLKQLLARLEEERDRLMRNASEMKNKDSNASDLKRSGVDLVGTSAQMESLKQDIKVLESTCRYLRQQARRAQIEENTRSNSWLHRPLLPPNKSLETKQQRKDSMQALQNLAMLPQTAKPVQIANAGGKQERLKWKPMASTLQYQLCEAEMRWLEAWEPMGMTKGPWVGGFGHFGTGDAVAVV